MIDLIIPTIIFIVGLAVVPVIAQFRCGVNNGAFEKIIKIKKFSFLFRAPDGISVSEEGVALPLFIMQVVGYILSLITGILNLLFYFVFQNLFIITAIITFIIFVIELITWVVLDLILIRISHPKQYFKRDKRK